MPDVYECYNILTYGTPRLIGIILNTKNSQFRRKLSNDNFKITDFSEKLVIFSKFLGHQIDTKNSPYIACIARIIMKVYSSGMNQDV